jgi:hypothetical protein
MAKKDPYKRIQKRFVEARAGDVEYDDLSLEDRERYQNRFNMLSQTVQGRTKIAQRVLPNADPEQRANFKQRIRQNLPSRGSSTLDGSSTLGEISDEELLETNTSYKPTPKQSTSEDVRFRNIGSRSTNAQRNSFRRSENTTTSKATTSDRYGSGVFSVPKSPTKAAVELSSGLDMVGRGLVDYATRGLVNPVINLVGSGLDKISAGGEGNKFKPLPVYSKEEVIQDAALTVITAGVGAAAKPFVRPTGRILKGIASGLSGRAPGAASAIANVAAKRANATAVRQATKLGDAGRRAVMERASTYGMEIPTGKVPDPSGAKFSAPQNGITIPKFDLPPISGKGLSSPFPNTTTKATTKSTTKATTNTTTKATTKSKTKATTTKSNLEQVAEARATSQPPSERYFDFPGTGPETSAGKSFADEFGDIEMLSTEYFPSPVRKPPKGGGKPKKPKQPKPKQPNINAPEIPPITKKDIEEATENFAPGFNENFGYIEERSVAPDFPDDFDKAFPDFDELGPGLGSDSNFGDVPDIPGLTSRNPEIDFIGTPPEGTKLGWTFEWFDSTVPDSPARIAPIDKAKITEDWVRAGGDGLGGGKTVPKPPKPPKTPKPSKVTEIKQAKNKTSGSNPRKEGPYLYEPDALDAEIAREAKDAAPRKVTVEKSKTEQFFDAALADEAAKREAKKKAFPGSPVKKVTKLPKYEPYSGQPVKGDDADSMLFRMYDQGKRPKKAYDDFAIGQPIDVDTGTSQRLTTSSGQPLDVDTGTSPRLYSETRISAATPIEVEKEIRETILIPEARIRQGKAVNLRLRKKTKAKLSDSEMATTASLDAEGEPRLTPFGIPSTEVGLSSEQRRAKFYRDAFPQARSAREARKLYEQSMGREDAITTIGEYGSTGSPLGAAAKKSPITTTEVQVPIAYKKGLNKKGEVVYKPTAFKEESVKGIWTTSSGKKATPIDDVVEMQYPRVGAEKAEAGRLERKAAKLKSDAERAASLRNKGIAGDEARSKYDEVVSAKAEGEKFQKSAEEVGKELSDIYETYLIEGFENKTLRPLLPPRPKPNIQPKPKASKKKKKGKS